MHALVNIAKFQKHFIFIRSLNATWTLVSDCCCFSTAAMNARLRLWIVCILLTIFVDIPNVADCYFPNSAQKHMQSYLRSAIFRNSSRRFQGTFLKKNKFVCKFLVEPIIL